MLVEAEKSLCKPSANWSPGQLVVEPSPSQEARELQGPEPEGRGIPTQAEKDNLSFCSIFVL